MIYSNPHTVVTHDIYTFHYNNFGTDMGNRCNNNNNIHNQEYVQIATATEHGACWTSSGSVHPVIASLPTIQLYPGPELIQPIPSGKNCSYCLFREMSEH